MGGRKISVSDGYRMNGHQPVSRWTVSIASMIIALSTVGHATAQESATGGAPVEAAQAATTVHEFNIIAQPLASALNLFGRQAGLQVSFDSALVSGAQAKAVRGTMRSDVALQELLRDSDVTGQITSDGIVVLFRDTDPQATMIDPVVVEGERQVVSSDYDGYVAYRSRSGTKTGTSIMRTPQAVNVITKDEIEDKGATTVTQALEYTPGVISQYGNTDLRHDWLSVRGFVPGRYMDGLRLSFGARGYAQPKIEPYGLEQIEVLKGPSSVLYGQNSPGGLLNMQSKRPTAESLREVFVQYGSYNHREAGFDVGGAATEDGTLQFRLTGVGRMADAQADYVSEDRIFIAPALTWQPTDETRLTILTQYQKIEADGGGAPPALPASGTLWDNPSYSLGPSTYIGEPDYDRFTNEQMSAGYEFEHKFNDTWEFKQNLRVGNVDTYTQRVQAGALVGNSLIRYAWAFPEESTTVNVDNQLISRFSTGDINHTVLGGVDYLWEDSAYDESFVSPLTQTTVGSLDLTDIVYTGDATTPPLSTTVRQDRYQVGFYLQEEANIDNWTVLLGGRYDLARATTDTTTVSTGVTSTAKQDDNAFSGRAGLVYEFDNGFAPYASYAQSFTPTSGSDRSGAPFDPTEGEQFELGVRYQPENTNSLITVSAYQLTQTNVLTPDPVNTSFRTQTGEVRVRGIEVEGKANLDNGIELSASYSLSDSEVTKANANSSNVTTKGKEQPFIPRHQAAAWVGYNFQQADLAGLGIGGGVRFIGSSYGDANNLYQAPGVTLFDAALHYDLGHNWQQLAGTSLSLTANNLLDEEYISTCISATGCYYGNGRTVMATLKYRW